jgi:uncharacterized protein with GYD domain
MPYYLMLTKLTDHGRKTLLSNPSRIKEVNAEVKEMGADIVAQYFLLGAYDFVNILLAPDDYTVARVAMELGSRGTLETMTMPAFGVDQLIRYVSAFKGYKRKE